jgi:hypothetical protein
VEGDKVRVIITTMRERKRGKIMGGRGRDRGRSGVER